MELLDRYLQAVRLYLPRTQQDDILRELSEDIRSQADDKEAALGRPLNEDEEAALLRQYGHPILLAARYRPQRPLIGPVILPFYWFAIKLALAITGFFWGLGVLGLIGSNRPVAEIMQSPLGFLHAALPAVGWVTFMFVAAEFLMVRFRLSDRLNRWTDSWDPRSLPKVKRQRQITRSESIKGLIIDAGLGIWWLAALQYPYLLWGSLPMKFAPVWQELYVPMVVLILVGIAQRCINLARPDWTWLPSATRLVTTIGGLAIAYRLVGARELVVGVGNLAGYDKVIAIVNGSVLVTLGISIAVCVPVVAFQSVLEVRRLLRGSGGQKAAGIVAG